MTCKRGFTLIELLIVVAIIGILAAIAVPNFLNSQLRAKVTRVYSDMGAIGTALEMYYLDNNRYPVSNYVEAYPKRVFRRLTTPTSYLATIPLDPFRSEDMLANLGGLSSAHLDYSYYNCDETDQYAGPNTRNGVYRVSFDWFLVSPGPDKITNWFFYHISNGVASAGDIYRASSKEELNSGSGGYTFRPN